LKTVTSIFAFRASEKASLFKYKAEVHQGDQENEQEEIDQLFPVFDEVLS